MAKPQKDGYAGMMKVKHVLLTYGRNVSFAGYYSPFDLLVDGKYRIEVKTCRGAKSSGGSVAKERNRTAWRFNIHRHGKLNESMTDGYILRLEDIPEFSSAAHLFLKAPIGVSVLNYNLRSFIEGTHVQAANDFKKFANDPTSVLLEPRP